jgi:hypothetical protein
LGTEGAFGDMVTGGGAYGPPHQAAYSSNPSHHHMSSFYHNHHHHRRHQHESQHQDHLQHGSVSHTIASLYGKAGGATWTTAMRTHTHTHTHTHGYPYTDTPLRPPGGLHGTQSSTIAYSGMNSFRHAPSGSSSRSLSSSNVHTQPHHHQHHENPAPRDLRHLPGMPPAYTSSWSGGGKLGEGPENATSFQDGLTRDR